MARLLAKMPAAVMLEHGDRRRTLQHGQHSSALTLAGKRAAFSSFPTTPFSAVLLLHPQRRGEASLASVRPGDHAVLIQHGTAVNGTCYVSDPHRFTWTARIIFIAVSRYILGNTFIRKDACQTMNQTALVKWNCVTSTQAF